MGVAFSAWALGSSTLIRLDPLVSSSPASKHSRSEPLKFFIDTANNPNSSPPPPRQILIGRPWDGREFEGLTSSCTTSCAWIDSTARRMSCTTRITIVVSTLGGWQTHPSCKITWLHPKVQVYRVTIHECCTPWHDIQGHSGERSPPQTEWFDASRLCPRASGRRLPLL
jgi:hypothetical protein